MTISNRRFLYHAFSFVSIGFLALALFLLLTTPWEILEAARFQSWISLTRLQFVSLLVSCFSLLLLSAGVTAVTAMGTGKSSSVEIFFFALWALSLSGESGRIGILLLSGQDANPDLLAALTRFVLFGRYFGMASLFLASIFSVGFKNERMNPAALLSACLVLFIATLQPLNTGTIDAQFLIARGYTHLALALEIALLIVTLLNYLVAWHNSGSKDFLVAGLASLVILASQITLHVATSLSPVLQMAFPPLCAAAAYVYLKTMYAYYLWR